MGTQANVVVLPQEPGELQIQDILLPDPGPTQVVVKLYASGVCHSQLHQMHSCLLYTSPSPRDLSTSRMPSSA